MFKIRFFCIVFFVLFLSACGTPPASPTVDIGVMQTAAVNTAWAALNLTSTANAPTPTRIPTLTPNPTFTPIPSNTPNPNLIQIGTYLVGSNIQPGIYRGLGGGSISSSCYWERLKDASGNFDSIIANGNGIGQYYVEIKSTDFAFKSECQMERLVTLPPPPAQFPQSIEPGEYLVGIDIQPGTYQGQAGSDISSSCYWARLGNVGGGFDAILANDNAIGQYFVQVAASDFAFSTKCNLTRIGN